MRLHACSEAHCSFYSCFTRGFPLRSEFANQNHSEAGSSKQCNDQRTDQTAFFLAHIITDFIRNTKRPLYDEKLEDALEMLDLGMEQSICSDVSQIQLDSSSISWLTVMISLTCCISIVVSPTCGSSSFPAYHGSALMKTMPYSLLPLVCIRFSRPCHHLLPRLRFSTKPQRQCLHFIGSSTADYHGILGLIPGADIRR